MMQDTIGRIYAPADSHTRAFLVLDSMKAAAPRDTSAVRPLMQPRRVVLSVLNPNDLIINEYWFVSPLAISWDQACRKKSHVLDLEGLR